MKEFISVNNKHAAPYEFYAHGFEPNSEIPARVSEIERVLIEQKVGELIYPDKFSQVPRELLEKIHDPAYVAFILESAKREQREIPENKYRYPTSFPYRRSNRVPNNDVGALGYYSIDTYTPVHEDLTDAALVSASGAYSAAVDILHGGNTSYSIGRPPGHHAGYDYMGGYCYFNNAMVAVETLREKGKVAILDVDFHHGNGTHDILDMQRMIDVADPDLMFPYFSGKKRMFEKPECFNYPLPLGVTNEQYDAILQRTLRRINDFNPYSLVVSIGYDTYKDDPIGGFQLTTDYYERMARQIMELKKPTVFIQEGGYNVAAIGHNARSFIKGTE